VVRQAVPLQPMEVHGGADLHVQPGERPHARAGGCPKEAVTLWGTHAQAGSCQDLWTRGERSPRRSRFASRTCDPAGDPRCSSLFLKSCSLWEGLMLDKFMEYCLPREGPHAGVGEECEEEGVAETTCDELTTTPIPHFPSPCAAQGEEIEKIRSEVEPLPLGRKEG